MPTRLMYDADSHQMETQDWLFSYVDSSVQRELLELPYPFEFTSATASTILAERAADPAKAERAQTRTFGQAFQAYGAWDSAERSRTLDMFGFSAQLVFATLAADIAHAVSGDAVWKAIRGLNHGLVDFCSSDARLLPVAYVPLSDAEHVLKEVDTALAEGAAAIHVSTDAKEQSPTHPDFEPLWARLAEARIPVVAHIGGGGPLVPNKYLENGKVIPPALFEGGEPISVRTFLGIPYWPEFFISVMTIDGVFERHPDLRCGVIEQGAEWLVTLLRRLDYAASSLGKRDASYDKLPMLPSEYLKRQVKVTPFYHEDVAWIVDQIGVDMLMFSSDYPHVEGGRDPIGKFTAALANESEVVQDQFFSGNFVEMMGSAMDRVPAGV